jgi:hypothetical protein
VAAACLIRTADQARGLVTLAPSSFLLLNS